jgi:hypothetical protein
MGGIVATPGVGSCQRRLPKAAAGELIVPSIMADYAQLSRSSATSGSNVRPRRHLIILSDRIVSLQL